MTRVAEQPVWITRCEDPVPAPTRGPIVGWRVGVKDNIDVAGVPTTAGCPEYAYVPAESAPCIRRLEAAGAVIIGKTNLDQFATGLVGTRSPYGPLSCVGNDGLVSGGSSSGSAVAVARGECEIALGTDTAGSGRVPAALNGIVGIKPTRGLISTEGVVPACRTLDCVSIFARDVDAAWLAFDVMCDPAGRLRNGFAAGHNRWHTPRIGIPEAAWLAAFGGSEASALFDEATRRLEGLGADLVPVDLSSFIAAGDLLYGGPWVAERLVAVGEFIAANPDATLDPTVREIIEGAGRLTAADAFRGMYRLEELRRTTRATWERIDVLALPTVTIAPTHEEVAADPIGVNDALGRCTRFVNLLDLCAVSVPAGRQMSGASFGLQLAAPPMSDPHLLRLAQRYERAGQTSASIELAVVGAHLRGQPLNEQLVSRGAQFVSAGRTSSDYRLYALSGVAPAKPGLVHVGNGGGRIEIEVWRLTPEAFGTFVADVPPPLAIGTLQMDDGSTVAGFVCEPRALDGALDITEWGGWRAYLNRTRTVGDARGDRLPTPR